MSVTIMGHVFAADLSQMSKAPSAPGEKDGYTLAGAEKFVLVSLADNATESGVCFPWVSTTAAKTDMSDRSVQRALRRLEEMKLIQNLPRFRPNGSQRGSLYKINITLLRSLRRAKATAEDNDEEAMLALFEAMENDGKAAGQAGGDKMSPPTTSGNEDHGADHPFGGDNLTPGGRQSVTPRGDNLSPLEPSVGTSREEPPRPPRPESEPGAASTDGAAPPASGAPRHLCDEHGRTTCRACRHNVRDADKPTREEAEADERRRREISRRCPWCSPSPDDDARIDERTRLPLSPRTTCDHVTPNAVVIAEIEEREAKIKAEVFEESDGAHRDTGGAPAAAGSGRAAAMALAREIGGRKAGRVQAAKPVVSTFVDDPAGRERARQELDAARGEAEEGRTMADLLGSSDEPGADERANAEYADGHEVES